MNLLHIIVAGTLIITLTIAAVLDFRYREIPRSIWLGAWLVAVPLGLYQWFGTYQMDQWLAVMNILVITLILIGIWFVGALRLPMGDLIGMSTAMIALSYGLYTLTSVFFIGIWSALVAGIIMIRERSIRAGNIPYMVPVALGVITAILVIR